MASHRKKIALATWAERIAPVFDVAQKALIIEVDSGTIVGSTEEALPARDPVQRAMHLGGLKVDILVCGAISQDMEAAIRSYGIQVFSFVAGEIQEVIQAWLKGGLAQARFAMPGCQGRKRQGRGCGNGRRRAGSSDGRDPQRFPSTGFCICVSCGYREPHSRGVPCRNFQCPTCGTPLTKS